MIKRIIEKDYLTSLEEFPVTALIGPRQVGKTTLVKSAFVEAEMIYLDLEKDSDINKLQDPELFFSAHINKTIILDEIQHKPELFPLIRALVDENRRPGRFVVLGSASPALLKQSSESLAGRINYLEMSPLSLMEVKDKVSLDNLWMYGGFPEPALSGKRGFVERWYRSFINTYIQRDLPLYGLPAAPHVTRQLLQMIASVHSRILNYSDLARSIGITVPTVKTYMMFLENAFLITLLQPWYANVGKRIVKSPKVYMRDTGVLHYLSNISTYDNLIGHIVAWRSWEGFVILQVLMMLRADDEVYFYRTQDGAEVDLLVRRNGRWLLAAEIRLTNSPVLTRGSYLAKEDLQVEILHVITPGADNYRIAEGVEVTSLNAILTFLANN
tara:strand:- start:709 stop:1863 length:1155 start_codon:yes stop_codon:yes gene_type:complete